MNILVTGATGFIGKKLIQSLLLENNVHILVRPNSKFENIGTQNIFIFDDNHEELANYFVENKIEGIVHLAALYIAQHETKDIKELILSNIYLGTALLEAAKIADIKWFLNTGTFWQNYISDSQEYCPVNLYAASKQAFIDMAKFYVETGDICFVTLKICDTYGKDDTRPKILNLFKRISESQETLSMSQGMQVLDLLYIDDVILGFLRLINSLINRNVIEPEYVLSALKCYTLKELANIYSKVSGKKLNIEWGGRPYRTREVMNPWNKGIILPNWKPSIEIETGIKLFLDIE
jgi:nucleoside-diphosphate-sugar epimerase